MLPRLAVFEEDMVIKGLSGEVFTDLLVRRIGGEKTAPLQNPSFPLFPFLPKPHPTRNIRSSRSKLYFFSSLCRAFELARIVGVTRVGPVSITATIVAIPPRSTPERGTYLWEGVPWASFVLVCHCFEVSKASTT